MNQRQLEIFISRYGAKVDSTYRNRHSYTYGYSNSYPEYQEKYGTVELELPMESLERLVHLDQAYDKICEEADIRRRSPAVADAYSKYQMMLTLYR